MAVKNPLRYPGAKTKLYSYIKDLLIAEERQGCVFYEPYAGSAAVSWNLLEEGIISKAIINERDILIYSFWRCVFWHTDSLIEKIENADISVETWKEAIKYRDDNYCIGKDIVELGFAGLFLNRTNFSGILKANPLGGLTQNSNYKIDCRFNKKKVIDSILNIAKYRAVVEVYNDDAIEFMKENTKYKRNRSIFVYIDPPYYEKGPMLYRHFYSKSQHEQLAAYIKTKCFPWLISYDDTKEIRKLYKCRNHIQLYLDYSVRTSKKGNELLISNLEIPPVMESEIIDDVIC